MTYTFSFAVKKFGASDVGRVKNHNLRAHPTSSQLRPEAWFTRLGHSSFVLWDDAKITQAKVLSTRKDAVVAIGFSLQLGAQTDWRSPPSESFPEGQPLPLTEARKQVLRNLREAAKVWAIEEFGESNLVSVDLHNDESTPHVQVVVTPIFDGKLQAKHWLNGGSTCAALRRRACDVMNRFVECTYVPGNPGGEPHDPGLSAGAKPAPGISKSREEELEQENAELKARVRALEQSLFSRSKSHYTKAVIEKSKQEAKSAIAA